MSFLTSVSLETAFLPPGTLSLADCLARIEQDHGLGSVRCRDMASGLRRLAAALDRPPALVPADLDWLRPRLARIEPASLDLSAKSWANVLSNARAALRACGVVEQPFRALDDLSPQWQALWDLVRASRDLALTTTLGRFVRFLDNAGVAPDEVGPEHLEAYREALALSEIRRSPEEGVRQARYAWNCATTRLEGWPTQTLPMAKSDKVYSLPLDTFPESFAEDLARYVARREHPNPLDENALKAPLRPATVKHRRGQVLRFASALVHAGVAADNIRGLADLVRPEFAKQGLTWLHVRQGNRTGPGLADTAVMLKDLARHDLHCPPEQLAEIVSFADKLSLPRQGGLTDKNRERLRQFEDPELLRRLLVLPERLFDRSKGEAGRTAALIREEALAVALLVHCPVRLRNLTGLHRERNLRRLRDGRVVLVFHGSEVKNRRPIEFELVPAVVALLDEHLATRAPLLSSAPLSMDRLSTGASPWLFPRRDGEAPIEPSHFSKRVCARIAKETGIEMNIHLFRHLAAMMFLAEHPGQYEVVRRLLGHAALSSTLSAYTGFEAGTAVRLFSEVISKAKRGRR